jgi:hypothetical protein
LLVVVVVLLLLLLLLSAGFEAALAGHLAAGATYSETITWPKVKRLLSVASNWIIIVQVQTSQAEAGRLQTVPQLCTGQHLLQLLPSALLCGTCPAVPWVWGAPQQEQ